MALMSLREELAILKMGGETIGLEKETDIERSVTEGNVEENVYSAEKRLLRTLPGASITTTCIKSR